MIGGVKKAFAGKSEHEVLGQVRAQIMLIATALEDDVKLSVDNCFFVTYKALSTPPCLVLPPNTFDEADAQVANFHGADDSFDTFGSTSLANSTNLGPQPTRNHPSASTTAPKMTLFKDEPETEPEGLPEKAGARGLAPSKPKVTPTVSVQTAPDEFEKMKLGLQKIVKELMKEMMEDHKATQKLKDEIAELQHQLGVANASNAKLKAAMTALM